MNPNSENSFKHMTQQIFINGRFLTQQVTGVQRYAREIIGALDELLSESPAEAGGLEFTLLVPRGTECPPLKRVKVQPCGRRSGHAWEQLDLFWHARSGLLVNLGFTGPLLHGRQIITVHDAAVVRVPEAYTARYRLVYRGLLKALVARSRAVMSVSMHSGQEAISFFGAQPGATFITTEGWQHLDRIEEDSGVLDRHGLRAEPYILAVSSATPNKNFGCVVKAMTLLGDKAPLFAVAGSTNNQVFRSMLVEHQKLKKLGYVSDAELKALYRHAHAFVFPSFYEGFGIPPLEAMSLGCPVIASTAQAVRETCGDAVIYFDPHSPQQLAEKISEMAGTPDLGRQLSANGLRRAQAFSWREGAQRFLRVVRDVNNQQTDANPHRYDKLSMEPA